MPDRPHFEHSLSASGVLTQARLHAPSELVCVELDGTLIRSDTPWESSLLLAKSQPWQLLRAAGWLIRGKAHFKAQLAARIAPDAALLPYRLDVLESLRELKSSGSTLCLATGADQRVAAEVAAHLCLFDAVVASDGTTNCSGANKLAAIRPLQISDQEQHRRNIAGDRAVHADSQSLGLAAADNRRGRVFVAAGAQGS